MHILSGRSTAIRRAAPAGSGVRRAILLGLSAFALMAAPVLAAAQTLTVSAAASLAKVLKDLGARYEAAHPGTRLQFSFAGSGVLLQQIAQGAPADVFVSADEQTLARGLAMGLFDKSTRRDIASNALVLIAAAGGGPEITGLAALEAPAVRHVAIGKPESVPAGRYARVALESAGLWARIESRLVYAQNVRQVLDYVARGEAEAGFVYATDAALMPDRVRIVARPGGHGPVRYPAILVAEGRQKPAAAAFLAFLAGAEAQALLARAGFGAP